MTGRDSDIEDFLRSAGWSNAARLTMTGDLSSRSYTRLVRDSGALAIMMNADPSADSSTPAFVRMTRWLLDADLSAPRIIAEDSAQGFLLLEDFGDDKAADHAADPVRRDALYALCIDLLIHIRAQTPPSLAHPDPAQLVAMTELADDHYPGIDAEALAPLRATLRAILEDLANDAATVSLRDFHVDNIMWLSQRTGLRRLGLLDYQDAFLTHPVYDLVSLLTDARTDIPIDFRRHITALYSKRTGDDPDRLALAFAALSAQRNLRILGIFTRAAHQLGKPHHLPKLPRVHRYLMEALDHPVFRDIAEQTRDAIPPPRTETA